MEKDKLSPLEQAYSQLESVTDNLSERKLMGFFLDAWLELTRPFQPNYRNYQLIDKITGLMIEITDQQRSPDFDDECARLFRLTAHSLNKNEETELADKFQNQSQKLEERFKNSI